tara:strand:- start:3844 stop:4644 length:801 start_codon:yes stop_codon:yes gene_type:complete
MTTFKQKIKEVVPSIFLDQPGRLFRSKNEIAKLKNKFKGKRCFIVGNGPSLNKIDIAKLDSEYSFAVNSIYYKTQEMGYKPSFYVVEDPHVINDNLKEINDYQCDYMFFPAKFKSKFKKGANRYFLNLDYSFYNDVSPYFETPRFSQDLSEEAFCGQSVTIVNLQLAYFLGFTEVYLIGMDFSYNVPDSAKVDGNVIESTEDDVNHFHPDYFGKGKKWHDPKLHNVLKSYRLAKLMFELDDRKVINATVGGNLEVFERVDFNTLFK